MNGFVVLIGSVARNDFNLTSDIDICRIGTSLEVKRNKNWPSGPISYIDYDINTFTQLIEIQSLFIYHIFNEGQLLIGDTLEWNRYKSLFSVKKDFTDELMKIIKLNQTFKKINIYGSSFVALYSNLFTAVKNFSIFFQANKGVYEFNKHVSILNVFGDKYIDILLNSYNYFERGLLSENIEFSSSKKLAEAVVDHFTKKMEELINAK